MQFLNQDDDRCGRSSKDILTPQSSHCVSTICNMPIRRVSTGQNLNFIMKGNKFDAHKYFSRPTSSLQKSNGKGYQREEYFE